MLLSLVCQKEESETQLLDDKARIIYMPQPCGRGETSSLDLQADGGSGVTMPVVAGSSGVKREMPRSSEQQLGVTSRPLYFAGSILSGAVRFQKPLEHSA